MTILLTIGEWIRKIDDLVWGPWLLVLLLGTGIYLMLQLRFLPLRRLRAALRCALIGSEEEENKSEASEGRSLGRRRGETGDSMQNGSLGRMQRRTGYTLRRGKREQRRKKRQEGRVSSFSSLMTELAATIGTGNILGVSTAMALGGPGALFWMVAASFTGMATKLVESTLSVKYRSRNEKGQVAGGPMYVMERAFPNRRIGHLLAVCFALFAVCASFGMGNMTQANSIADALWVTFGVPRAKSGLIFTILTILVVLGGISSIGKVTRFLVPAMGVAYLLGTLAVILLHWENIPVALGGIFTAALSPAAVSGGLFGQVTASAFGSLRWGVSRGIFSNEAGLGAAGISAAAADTEDYIKQGYISMTGVFLDTAVICTATGLALAASGALGAVDASGKPLTGTALTLAAFRSVLGAFGEQFIGICIVLFAFATIVGWAYQGERAFEFLMGGQVRYHLLYRFIYGFMVFTGCFCPLQLVWDLSDLCNGLMAVPNLICVLVLSRGICREIREYKGLGK